MARQALFSLVFRSIIFLLKCSFCYFLDLMSEANAQQIQVGSKGTFGLFLLAGTVGGGPSGLCWSAGVGCGGPTACAGLVCTEHEAGVSL